MGAPGKIRIYRDQDIVTVEIVDTWTGVKAHAQFPQDEFWAFLQQLLDDWRPDVHQP